MKRLFVLIAAIALITAAVPCAIAADGNSEPGEGQMEQAQERFREMAEAFDSLTDAQKNKIYKLDAKISDLLCQMAELYEEYGVITEEEAERMCDTVTSRSDEAKEKGYMPGLMMPR